MNKRFYTAIFLIFLISGFSGLIYESIWTQYLKLFLGHAAYAQTLVLIIFMGGMAIGSYIASIYSHKWKNLFFAYAIAEGIIGLFALFFHETFTLFLEISYTTVFKSLEDPIAVSVYKWMSAALLILPQSILLGTTFPLMSAAVLRAFPKSPGKNISLLYFTNSLGAGIGVLVSGFYFIKTFGLPGTIRIAGLINVLIALLVLYLIRTYWVQTSEPIVRRQPKPEKRRKNANTLYLLLGVAAFTGMASFIYEIAWIRMLNMVLGTSTHAFELMLSAFIFGLAFGGLWIRKRIDQISNPIAYLGYIQIIMGAMALLTLLLYGSSFNFMQWILENVMKDDTGYFLFNLSSNGIAMLIMFPATFCAGMTLPLITTILLQTHGEKSIGAVYAWNTIGCIVGVIFAVYIGMPILGLKGLVSFGAGIDIVLGLLLFFVIGSFKYKFRLKLIISSLGVLTLLLIGFLVDFDPFKMASGVFRGRLSLLSPESNEILFNKDGKTASVSVIHHKEFSDMLSIRTNGKTDATIYKNKTPLGTIDESTMIQLATIPMALHPKATHVANIGLGFGITTRSILANPNIKSVHTIEIEEEMVHAVKQLGVQGASIFNDPRSNIVIDDAKSFFASNNNTYDIILSEPSNPWINGVSGLFTKEFYSLIHQQLNSEGIFGQWLQLYDIDIDLVASVLKSVSQSFSDYRVYFLNDTECLIVAKNNGLLQPLDIEFLKTQQIEKDLSYVSVNNVQDIEFRLLGNKKLLDPFFASFSIPSNSDYYPVLDQNATQTRFLGMNANELQNFVFHLHPILALLNNTSPRWDETNITPTPFYSQMSVQANEAMALRDFFLYNNFDKNYQYLPDQIRNEAILIKKSFSPTSDYTEGQNRMSLILNTSFRMTPYLTPNEMEQVWTSLDILQDPNLTPKEYSWVTLSMAIAQRDAKTMVNTGELLLENSKGISVFPKEYLVSAIMLGYMMQDKKDAAQLVWWQEFQGKLSENPRSRMLFKFLMANCQNSN